MKKPATWISDGFQTLRAIFKAGEKKPGALPVQPHAAQPDIAQKDGRLTKFVNLFRCRHGQRQKQPLQAQKSFLNLSQLFAMLAKTAVILACIVALYGFLGFYLLPGYLKTQIPDLIKQETGWKASVASIEFNPFKLFAEIRDFKMLAKNGQPFVNLGKLNVKVNVPQSLTQFALVIDEINVLKPNIRISRDHKGHFNFDDLIKKQDKNKGGLFPLSIAKLSLKDGKVSWEDKHVNKPIAEDIGPINLKLADFSTQVNHKAKLDIDLAVKSGGKLAIKSKLGISPIFSEGNLKLDNIQLAKIVGLTLADTAPFTLKGEASLGIDYKAEQNKNILKFAAKKSRLEIKGFEFQDKSSTKNFLAIPNITLEHDGLLTLTGSDVDLKVNKAKAIARDVQFYNQANDPVRITLSNLSHEADIRLTQSKGSLKITSDKFVMGIKNFQFKGVNQGSIQADIPVANIVASHTFEKTDKTMDASLNHGKFNFNDLHVQQPGENTTLIKVPAFNVTELVADLKSRTITIEKMTSSNAEFRSWLNPDGTLNYQQLIASKQGKHVEVTRPDYATAKTVDLQQDVATVAAAAKAVEPEKDWLITLKNLVLNNYTVFFEDRMLKKPVPLSAKLLNLTLNNVTNKPDAKLLFQLAVGVNNNGQINLRGFTLISPLLANADVDIKNIDLDPLQPYLQHYARLDLLEGQANMNGKATIALTEGKPLDIRFKGDAGIADLLTRDQLLNKDLVKWQNLTFKALDVDISANRYAASTLLIEKPFVRVAIRKDKTVNFSDIMISTGKPANTSNKVTKSTVAKADTSAPPLFKLAKIQIVEGSSDFSDMSLILPFAAQIKDLNGGATGIDSHSKANIKVALAGKAHDIAPVEVKGDINPYSGNYNIDMKFDGLPMPLVTPYMVQFAGYKIEKGQLTLELHYDIEHMSKLKASNKILINQLELGEKVDNPNAVSIPLRLAITLLKDSEGKIRLDVPLTGSLEDPKFSIGGLIGDALLNAITKVVTSPFNALAALADVDGNAQDLSTVVFKPGSNKLEPKERVKLDNLAKALKEKKKLNLDIKGTAFEKDDWPALEDDALLDLLKQRKAAILSKAEGKKIRPEYVELSENDYNAMLAEVFIEKFPTMAKKTFFGTPTLTNPNAGDFYKVAKQTMQVSIKPESERLKHLADDRATAIASYLIETGGIASNRLFILDSAIDQKRKDKDIASLLSLKVN